MAYSSTAVERSIDTGIAGRPTIFLYRSSDPSTAISAAGFFAGAGQGGRPLSTDQSKVHGMKLADLVCAIESSNGGTAGRVTWHSVTASTANQGSTTASTGYNTLYDVTVSAAAT